METMGLGVEEAGGQGRGQAGRGRLSTEGTRVRSGDPGPVRAL